MLNEEGLKAAAIAMFNSPAFQPARGPWEGSGRASESLVLKGMRAAITAYLSTVEKPVEVCEPGFDWTVSPETDQAMRDIDESIRAAHVLAPTTFVGAADRPVVEKPDSRAEELREAARRIMPYLRWTISDESPGFPPTMPSAVYAFMCAFGWETEEKWRDDFIKTARTPGGRAPNHTPPASATKGE